MSGYTRLIKYIDYLVECYAVKKNDTYDLFIKDIPELELSKLLHIYFDYNESEVPGSVSSKLEQIIESVLLNDSWDNQMFHVEQLKKSFLESYKDPLQILIDEACNSYLHDKFSEKGILPSKHADNGELSWGAR